MTNGYITQNGKTKRGTKKFRIQFESVPNITGSVDVLDGTFFASFGSISTTQVNIFTFNYVGEGSDNFNILWQAIGY